MFLLILFHLFPEGVAIFALPRVALVHVFDAPQAFVLHHQLIH